MVFLGSSDGDIEWKIAIDLDNGAGIFIMVLIIHM